MRQNAGLGWWLGAVVVVVFTTAIPSWSEDGSQEMLTRVTQHAGAMPANHLGAGRLDGDLGRADARVDEVAGVPFAQAGGVSGAAAARPVEPEPADQSASELNRKLTTR
jgi:hypothetical protein